jgi:Lipopolysaccharide kinase (Kdo/WaaP) family
LHSKDERGNLPVPMQASNKGTGTLEDQRFRGGIPDAVDAMFAGGRGFTVRCTPRRRTVMAATSDGELLFAKLRDGDVGDAKAEWHWLHVLPMLGLAVPQPVAFERRGRRSMTCTAAASGRPLDVLLLEHLRAGDAQAAVQFACAVVAPQVAVLHEQGLVFRDLYWNHLFATSLRADARLVFVDVERVCRPRFRKLRWWVKDLAGLLSSFPGTVAARDGMRFLRAYARRRGIEDRRLLRYLFVACRRKAERIRRHVPKFG